MTFISLADGCRRLGIDAKTLRRWLAHEELPLEPHPGDGRKKGVRSESLLLLATLHHRALEAEPQAERARPVSGETPTLPAELLGLSETLGALHAQLAALQQQVAELSHLLHQPTHPSLISASAIPATKRPSKPAPLALRSRPASAATKPPRKPAHVLPLVEYAREGHYVVICPKKGRLTLEPDTPAWLAWLETQSSFRFVGRHGRFTAHHEVLRVPNGAWRAHRHIRNHSYTLRLGLTQDLTMAVLEQAAATLQAHLK